MATYDGNGVSQRLIYQTVHLETDNVHTRTSKFTRSNHAWTG